MRRDVNGVTKSRFEMFSNSDEAVINKKLPKELLLRIFSFLDVVTLCRCAQVSRAWNVLALDGSNWQRIDLFDFQRDIELNFTKASSILRIFRSGHGDTGLSFSSQADQDGSAAILAAQ